MAFNSNPQAVFIANDKIRPAADKLAQLYNFFKALQAEAQAENWTALFPANADTIDDGATADGRTIIDNTDVSTLIATAGSFITFMEQNSNANRNNALKIATHPERF